MISILKNIGVQSNRDHTTVIGPTKLPPHHFTVLFCNAFVVRRSPT